ncbi:MAG: hypothetical protein OXH92_00065 [Bryobacterales bacterium]|nr:hypothetical protein [Gammaproteobacteria bacterium]MDE0432374.1 hypothetical protein [Bryobacterales bacterium]
MIVGDLAHAECSRIAVTKRSPDPKDDPILAIAVVGDAELVVSGDRSDMLALGHVEGRPIRSPREALAIALRNEAADDSQRSGSD